MLEPGEADALLRLQAATRRQQSVANPIRRRQPKVGRMQSPRQRVASSQTINPVKAIYGTEGQWNVTPVRENTDGLTRNVGPSDMSRNGYNPAKATTSTEGGGYPRDRRRQSRKPTGIQGTKKRTQSDWDALADQYDI